MTILTPQSSIWRAGSSEVFCLHVRRDDATPVYVTLSVVCFCWLSANKQVNVTWISSICCLFCPTHTKCDAAKNPTNGLKNRIFRQRHWYARGHFSWFAYCVFLLSNSSSIHCRRQKKKNFFYRNMTSCSCRCGNCANCVADETFLACNGIDCWLSFEVVNIIWEIVGDFKQKHWFTEQIKRLKAKTQIDNLKYRHSFMTKSKDTNWQFSVNTQIIGFKQGHKFSKFRTFLACNLHHFFLIPLHQKLPTSKHERS